MSVFPSFILRSEQNVALSKFYCMSFKAANRGMNFGGSQTKLNVKHKKNSVK